MFYHLQEILYRHVHVKIVQKLKYTRKRFKDVFGSFPCASYCAGVPGHSVKIQGTAGSIHTRGVTFFFNFPILKIT